MPRTRGRRADDRHVIRPDPAVGNTLRATGGDVPQRLGKQVQKGAGEARKGAGLGLNRDRRSRSTIVSNPGVDR